MKRKTSPFTWGVAAGLAAGVVLWLGARQYRQRLKDRAFESAGALSSEQVYKLADALLMYQRLRGGRPGKIEDLISAGLVSPADLCDPRRRPVPEIDPASGRLTSQPDCLYFPGLPPGHPPELILLCTLFARTPGGKLLVICNDRRVMELRPHALVKALNHTYAFMARGRAGEAPTSAPAPAAGGRHRPATTAAEGGNPRPR